MVVIVNESTVNKNPKMLKYKNLAAFALGKAPSLTDVVDKDGKPVVNYNYVNFLPDKDTINAVISGDMSAKKVIKKAIKALRNPSTENQAIGMTVVHLVHMITDEYRTKNQVKDGPSVLAFILDDPDTDEQQAINKFLTRYVTAVFQEFGFDPVTNKKTIKKLFDGNRKKRIKRSDFIAAGVTMGIEPKIVEKLIGKYVRLQPRMSEFIGQSFLDEELKIRYKELLNERMGRISGSF